MVAVGQQRQARRVLPVLVWNARQGLGSVPVRVARISMLVHEESLCQEPWVQQNQTVPSRTCHVFGSKYILANVFLQLEIQTLLFE